MKKEIYTLTANSCEPVSINCGWRELKSNEAISLASILTKAFRQVEIIDNETGEVCLTKYYSSEFFFPTTTYGKAIQAAETELERIRN